MNESEERLEFVEKLSMEFVDRLRRGEHPSIREYAENYSDYREEIEDLFPALAVMENLAPNDQSEAFASVGPTLGGEEIAQIEQLGDYRIVREIGRGGMGIVYEAEQISLGRHVALKVLPAHLMNHPKQRMRFEREARAAAKLHHTNIVPVFGIGGSGQVSFYVMQFIQGQGLDLVIKELRRLCEVAGPSRIGDVGSGEGRQRDLQASAIAQSLVAGRSGSLGAAGTRSIATGKSDAGSFADKASERSLEIETDGGDDGPLEFNRLSQSSVTVRSASDSRSDSSGKKQTIWQSIARIGVQVADALHYAHGQGVMHRDIKPSNLLLDLHGAVWITDFGLAKSSDDQGLTQTGDILGTLRYMAPETFRGGFDARSEVYSLGMTLYELLALRPAFAQRSSSLLIEQVAKANVAPLSKANPNIPGDLQTIVHKAIDADPGRRYASPQELADDLRRFLSDLPILARRESSIAKLARWARRNRGLAASLAFAAVLLAAGAAASTVAALQFRALASDREEALRDREEALRKAIIAGNRAQAATKESQRREALERWERYRSNISAALGARQLDNLTGLAVALDSAPEEYRDWEWRHLSQGLDTSVVSLPSCLAFCPATQQAAIAVEGGIQVKHARGEAQAVDLSISGGVESALFSDDGKLLGTCSRERRLQIWDTASGAPIASAQVEQTAIFVQFSASGDQVVLKFVSADQPRRSWRFREGQTLYELPHVDLVPPRISPTGKIIVADDGIGVKVINATTLEHLTTVPGNMRLTAFNPDGSQFATGAAGILRLCDGRDGAELRQIACSALAECFAWSGDGNLLAIGERFPSQSITIFDTATTQAVAHLQGHHNTIQTIAFSGDCSRLVSTSLDRTVRVWKVADGSQIAVFRGHRANPRGASFSGDGKHVLSYSLDERAERVWDAETGAPLALLPCATEYRETGFTPGDQSIYILGAAGLRVWDRARIVGQGRFEAHDGGVYDVAFSPDGEQVASCAWDGEIRLWNADDGALVARLSLGEDWYCRSIAWHPSGGRLASSAVSRTGILRIAIWDLQRAAMTASWDYPGDTEDVRVSWDPTGEVLLSGCTDGTVRWHREYSSQAEHSLLLHKASPKRHVCRHEDTCSDVAWSPDKRHIATAGYDMNVCLVDARQKEKIATLRGHTDTVLRVQFSPDGRLLASASLDATVKLWDAESHKLLETLPHGTPVYGLAFSRDGKRLVTACGDTTLRFWDVATRTEVAQFVGKRSFAHAVSFSPDGTRLATCFGDGSLQILDTLSDRERVERAPRAP